MKRKWFLISILLIVGLSVGVMADSKLFQGEDREDSTPPPILSFATMYGVDGPLLGGTNAIRGVIGDEAPWVITHFIKGRLDTSGRLQILVRGLVFGNDPSVDPAFIGKNDEPTYRGAVNCLTEDASGGIVPATVITHGFHATLFGNSFIDERLDLPNPCIAPIVFVMAGSEDKWFAVTGFESHSGSEESHRR